MNILIVEDDPNLSLLWNSVFASSGHAVDSAHSAVDARRALMSKTYDLVLIDCYLGKDISLSVSSLAASCSPACKIVMVTGSSGHACHELQDQGTAITAVLRKPVDIEHLVAVCDHIGSTIADNDPARPRKATDRPSARSARQ